MAVKTEGGASASPAARASGTGSGRARSAEQLRGRGGDVISRAAGSGVLDEGALAAKAKLAGDIDQGKVIPPGIAGTDPRSGQ